MYEMPIQAVNFQCFWKSKFVHPIVFQAYFLAFVIMLVMVCCVCVNRAHKETGSQNDAEGEFERQI